MLDYPDGLPQKNVPVALVRRGKKREARLVWDAFNKRIKIASFTGDLRAVALDVFNTADEYKAEKIIAYVTKPDVSLLRNCGFGEEGQIPGFFCGKTAYCLVAYPEPGRAIPRNRHRADEIIKAVTIKNLTEGLSPSQDSADFSFRAATDADVHDLADLYHDVFEGQYPTPITDPAFLRRAMSENTVFWLASQGSLPVGAASLEIDRENNNAELTDCAVNPQYRGKGLMKGLIVQLEKIAQEMNIGCLYSLSRALVPGINKVFADLSYSYCGRMINNCIICGDFEDMNIWVKNI